MRLLVDETRARRVGEQGVKDVVVFDPTSLLVLHARRDGTTRNVSPQSIEFECGCAVTV